MSTKWSKMLIGALSQKLRDLQKNCEALKDATQQDEDFMFPQLVCRTYSLGAK